MAIRPDDRAVHGVGAATPKPKPKPSKSAQVWAAPRTIFIPPALTGGGKRQPAPTKVPYRQSQRPKLPAPNIDELLAQARNRREVSLGLPAKKPVQANVADAVPTREEMAQAQIADFKSKYGGDDPISAIVHKALNAPVVPTIDGFKTPQNALDTIRYGITQELEGAGWLGKQAGKLATKGTAAALNVASPNKLQGLSGSNGKVQAAGLSPESVKRTAQFAGNLAGGAVTMGIGVGPGLVMLATDPKRTLGAMGEDFKTRYTPLVHGDFGEFQRQFYANPAAYLFDFWAAGSSLGHLGGMGRISREGTITADGGSVTRHTSPNPLSRWVENQYNAISEAHPDVPVVGAKSRSVRARRLVRERNLDRAMGSLSELATYARVLDKNKPLATAFDVMRSYGDKAPEFVNYEIQLRQRIISELEQSAQTRKLGRDEIRELRRQRNDLANLEAAIPHLQAPPEILQHTLNLARQASDEATRIRVEAGITSPEAAADIVNRRAQAVFPLEGISSPIYDELVQKIRETVPEADQAAAISALETPARVLARYDNVDASTMFDRIWAGTTDILPEGALTQIDPFHDMSHIAHQNLKAKLNPRTQKSGLPSNKRYVSKKNGHPVIGDITPQEWVARLVDTVKDPAERDRLARWYEHFEPLFRETFGNRADAVMRGFAVSQANASPAGGLLAVLRILGKMQRKEHVSDKEFSVVAPAIKAALEGETVTSSVAAKLSDFIDSLLGSETRTWMGHAPEGGRPAAVDIHALRDLGYVDKKIISRLASQHGLDVKRVMEPVLDKDGKPVLDKKGKPKEIERVFIDGEEIRVEPGSATGSRYERASEKYAEITDYLNEINFDGRNDWTPAQTQALGWSAIQQFHGVIPEDLQFAVDNTTREIISPGATAKDLSRVAKEHNAAVLEVSKGYMRLVVDDIEASKLAAQIARETGQETRLMWLSNRSKAKTPIVHIVGKADAELKQNMADLGFTHVNQSGAGAIFRADSRVDFGQVKKTLSDREIKFAGKVQEEIHGEGAHHRGAVGEAPAAKAEAGPEGEVSTLYQQDAGGGAALLSIDEARALPDDPNYLWHGTSPQAARNILGGRFFSSAMSGGLGEGSVWLSENPRYAAQYAASKFGGDGVVIRIPRQALPETAEPVASPVGGPLGGTNYRVPEDVLFQRLKDWRTGELAAPKGAVTFGEDGRATLYLNPDTADLSTVIHESSHVLRRNMPADQLLEIERWLGVKNGAWTVKKEEKFARAMERYWRQGQAPTPQLADAFATAKQSLTEAYSTPATLGKALAEAEPETLKVIDELWNPNAGVTAGEGAFYAPDTMGSTFMDRLRTLPRGTTKPKRAKRNMGILFTSARAKRGARVSLEDSARAQRTKMQLDDIDFISEQWGKPLNADLPGGLDEGYTYWNPEGVRIPRSVKQELLDDPEVHPRAVADAVQQDYQEMLGNLFPDEGRLGSLPPEMRQGLQQVPEWVKKDHMYGNTRLNGGGSDILKIVGGAFDSYNNLNRLAGIYLKPAYTTVNFASNELIALLKQGPWHPVNLAYASGVLGNLTKPVLRMLDEEVGSGGSIAISGNGRGLLGTATDRVAHFQNMLADRLPRRTAIIHELRKAGVVKVKPGYDNNAAIVSFLKDPTKVEQLNRLGLDAENSMVRFRGSSPIEQQVVSRAIYVYPWIKGATRYAVRLPWDMPVRAAFVAHLGQEGWDWVEKELGTIASFLRSRSPIGPIRTLPGGDKVARVIDPNSLTPQSTFADVLGGVYKGVAGAKNAPSFTKAATQLASPSLGLLLGQASGTNDLGRDTGNVFDAFSNDVPNVGIGSFVHGLISPPSSKYFVSGGRKEVVGRFFAGSLYPRTLNVTEAQKAGLKALPTIDRWKQKMRAGEDGYTAADVQQKILARKAKEIKKTDADKGELYKFVTAMIAAGERDPDFAEDATLEGLNAEIADINEARKEAGMKPLPLLTQSDYDAYKAEVANAKAIVGG